MAEKIIIVDDDLDTLRLVGLMLQRQGYEIITASNGNQAISMVQTEQPDLILLDVMMPDMDGYEVTRRLRKETSTAHIPIIMFTAKSQVDDKVLGFETGVDDYLTKPTQPRELFAHVKAVLSRSAQKQESRSTRERAHVIGILSAKGGLGVSTICLNLGISIRHRLKKDVIVADYRPGQGTIGLSLGYTKAEGLNHLLERMVPEITHNAVEGELINHTSGIRLLMASHQPRDSHYSIVATAQFEAITQHLTQLTKFVILDLGSSLSPVTERTLAHCDDILIITEPVPPTIIQTKALIADLVAKGFGQGRISIVLLNRVRSSTQLSWQKVQDELGYKISLTITPAPELAYQAQVINIPLVLIQRDSITASQFNRLAEIIAGNINQGT